MPLKRIGGIIGAAAANKVASKIQGKELGGLAFGILNDFLAGYRDDSGFARPSRFEVLVLPPSKLKLVQVVMVKQNLRMHLLIYLIR